MQMSRPSRTLLPGIISLVLRGALASNFSHIPVNGLGQFEKKKFLSNEALILANKACRLSQAWSSRMSPCRDGESTNKFASKILLWQENSIPAKNVH
jgi:hypothetical protein